MRARSRFLPAGFAVAALLVAADVSAADAIYRCGHEYTRIPCAAGRVVDTSDVVAAAERTEAERSAERARSLAESMARDRRARESARPAAATSLGPTKLPPEPPSGASASLKPKKKAKGKIRVVDGDDFVAKVPSAKKAASQPR